jgi:hypothetical protein
MPIIRFSRLINRAVNVAADRGLVKFISPATVLGDSGLDYRHQDDGIVHLPWPKLNWRWLLLNNGRAFCCGEMEGARTIEDATPRVHRKGLQDVIELMELEYDNALLALHPFGISVSAALNNQMNRQRWRSAQPDFFISY